MKNLWIIVGLIFAFSFCKKESLNQNDEALNEIGDEGTNGNSNDSDTSSPKEIHYLALGDSYTIGESVAVQDRYPNQFISRLDGENFSIGSFKIIAQTGWRTDNLTTAINNAELRASYDLVSLLIGVNNQFQGRSSEEYKTEFESLLKKAIELAGGDKNKVFVLSIPDYGFTPFGKDNKENISPEIDVFNAINQKITQDYDVKYFNITPISRRGLDETDLVASDGLHPSGEMYEEWVEMFYDEVKLKLKE